MKAEQLIEIKQLTELEMDIMKNGKIQASEEDGLEFFVSRQDRFRVRHLDKLMGKYTYGWYIAEESLENQLASIAKFKIHILSLEKESVKKEN